MNGISDNEVVDRLNIIVGLDPVCIGYIIDWRTNANKDLATHDNAEPHISYWEVPEMGILEILNFVMGPKADKLKAVKDEDGNLLRFELVAREAT